MPKHAHRPFRGSAALPGVVPWDLRSGRYRRLFFDVFVSRQAHLTPELLAAGALLLAPPDSFASHQTAARIWGGVVPDDPHTHVTAVGRRPQVEGIRSHRPKAGQRVSFVNGVRLTTPIQTFLDLAQQLGVVDLVVLGDSLVRGKRCTPDQLVAAAAEHRGPGCRMARRAARLVRPGVDSPMESRLRMLMVLAGLPEPVVNHAIRDRSGAVRYRFDLSFPEYRLVIEYDGRQHAESDRQWGVDIGRREWMDRNGWRIVVNVAKDIFRTPARTLTRITGAMRDQGMTVPRLRDEWRAHFPGAPEDLAHPA